MQRFCCFPSQPRCIGCSAGRLADGDSLGGESLLTPSQEKVELSRLHCAPVHRQYLAFLVLARSSLRPFLLTPRSDEGVKRGTPTKE